MPTSKHIFTKFPKIQNNPSGLDNKLSTYMSHKRSVRNESEGLQSSGSHISSQNVRSEFPFIGKLKYFIKKNKTNSKEERSSLVSKKGNRQMNKSKPDFSSKVRVFKGSLFSLIIVTMMTYELSLEISQMRISVQIL